MNALVSGLLQGGAQALLAFSLSVLFSLMRLVNFAHGDFLTVALFGVIGLSGIGLGLIPMALVLAVGMAAIGVIAYGLVFSRTLRSDKPGMTQVVATVGVSLVIQNLLLAEYGSDTRSYHLAHDSTFELPGDIIVSVSRLLPSAVLVVVLVVTWLLLRHTAYGLRARAVAENLDYAQLTGIRVGRTYAVVCAFSFALLGISAVALAPTYLVYPTAGFNMLLIAFMAVVIGGLGSIGAAVLGALILGVVQSLTAFYVSPLWAPGFMYLVFVAVLLLRPNGLMGNPQWKLE